METLAEDSNQKMYSTVVPYTKKKSAYGDRFLPLGEYELEIFEKIKKINEKNNFKDEDFIFCDENGRTKIREIDNRIRKLCNLTNITPAKSAHDIRRTVATQMHMQGIPIQIIKEFLGHSDTKTTWGYIVNNQEKAVVHSQIKNTLSNLNGLNPTKTKKPQNLHKHCKFQGNKKARDGIRTRDPDLGKVVLYQLSHSRMSDFSEQ